jgi:hypothetical protein
MEIIKEKISIEKLKEIAKESFGDLVKAVVDVEKEIMVVGGELHSDEEALLLENGSKQKDLWGINLYPEREFDDWIEFYSIINLRPAMGNKSCDIDDIEIKRKIYKIVNKLVER